MSRSSARGTVPGGWWSRLRAFARPRPRPRVRSSRLLPVLALLAACDYPTALPKWNTEWLVPVSSTTVRVSQLLPAGVGVTPDNAAFSATVAPVTLSRSLAELCGTACSLVGGRMVPKPAFTASIVDTLRLPAGVAGATLAGGTVSVTLTNGLSFDPLRPSATARGTLTIDLVSGGGTVGHLSLAGDSVALPPNGSLTRPVVLTGQVAGQIEVVSTLVSPAGDPVLITLTEQLSATAAASAIRLSDVSVLVAAKAVTMDPLQVDLSGIDDSVAGHVNAGALLLNVVNPFGATGTMTLTITSSGMSPIVKPVPVVAGSSTQRVTFTADELHTILGRQLTMTATGAVSADGAVRLTPSQAVQIDAQMDLVVGPKEL